MYNEIFLNNTKVLILGGSKEQSGDQIMIMDQDKKVLSKHTQKLSIPKAKCYGRFSRNILTKKIIREENKEIIQEESKNLIIILGGSSYQLDLEIYQLLDEDNLQIKLQANIQIINLYSKNMILVIYQIKIMKLMGFLLKLHGILYFRAYQFYQNDKYKLNIDFNKK